MKRLAALAITAVTLTGCTSLVQNIPALTAQEMLLPSHAASRAAAGLDLKLPKGTKAFLDASSVGSTFADKVTVEKVRLHLIGRGLWLVDRPAADVIIELCVSSDGLSDLNRVLGVPATYIPSMTPGQPGLSMPELSLWSQHRRTSVVEIEAVAWDAKTGKLISAVGPVYGTSTMKAQFFAGVGSDDLGAPVIRAERP